MDKLLLWLMDPSDDRLLTPTSHWRSSQAHEFMLNGTINSAKEMCFKLAPQRTESRPMIAEDLSRDDGSRDHLWLKVLISKLKNFEAAN